ncbi:MAG: NADP-dependent malic enzyme [Calditrichaeota bacterium]|nr:NADP-dependent malic enzyme [Calditrichota bacterium]MCB9367091.1 NADP-dependent malic enzyme [Calditrichota bacterium]
MALANDALEYHSREPKGKIEVVPTKPVETQYDLSLAYSPGVAEPCLQIQKRPELASEYTARQNLVAVVSNGTAVLGLGNIGALAGKPVMEGKGVLFKRFAAVDVFDIEIQSEDPEEVIRVCQLLEPTFGAINLEDIAAPQCFYIEDTLKRTMGIPVFHDDQHGTAIISGAGLLNSLKLVDKKIADVRVVVNGAGASAIACAKMYISLGVDPMKILMCDTKGTLRTDREDMHEGHARFNPYKASFARETDAKTLADALIGADVFCGCSVGGVVTQSMVKQMAENPIIFALANPDPEIAYNDAMEARPDAIVCTGRSDFPNQINNVLGFPAIFRGALDCHATQINEEMKMAASRALAELAMEDVPDYVSAAYGLDYLHFGREYVIPKPMDHRVLLCVAIAVARAAGESGVARNPITDFDAYRNHLEKLLGSGRHVTRIFIDQARLNRKRIVFPEGSNPKILRAAGLVVKERIGYPMLLGDTAAIQAHAKELGINLNEMEVLDPERMSFAETEQLAGKLWDLRNRKGMTLLEARKLARNPNYLGPLLLREGRADALVAGIAQHYSDTVRPALQILPKKPGVNHVAAMYALIFKNRNLYLADVGVNVELKTSEDLAEIAILSADTVRDNFMSEPRVAMLSFSDFGNVPHSCSRKVADAVKIVRKLRPDILIDGEMQADTALDESIINTVYPFSVLRGQAANVLVFPDLNSANISYKLLVELGGATAIGPILMGMNHAVHILQPGCSVNDIFQMAAYAAVDARH